MIKYFWPDLRQRVFAEELMDRPDCDLAMLKKTVEQFGLLNSLFSSSRGLIRKHLLARMRREPAREWTLLDVGAGGCDIDIWLVKQARKLGLNLKITALDYDRRIIPWAREATRDYPEITVIEGSAFNLEEYGEFDFAFSNHVLHHLTWVEIALVMTKLRAQVREAFLLNDLVRSNWAYLGYTIFTGLFVRGSLAFYDGRLSIQRGFRPAEAQAFLDDVFPGQGIGLDFAVPARLAFVWKKAAP